MLFYFSLRIYAIFCIQIKLGSQIYGVCIICFKRKRVVWNVLKRIYINYKRLLSDSTTKIKLSSWIFALIRYQ